MQEAVTRFIKARLHSVADRHLEEDTSQIYHLLIRRFGRFHKIKISDFLLNNFEVFPTIIRTPSRNPPQNHLIPGQSTRLIG